MKRLIHRLRLTLALLGAASPLGRACVTTPPDPIGDSVRMEPIATDQPLQQLHRETHGLDCNDTNHMRLLNRVIYGYDAVIESTDSVDLIVARRD